MVDKAEVYKRFDIHEIAKKKLSEIEKYKCNIYCCHSTGCKSSGSDDLIALIQEILKENNLTEDVRVVATGCMGLCAQGPLIRVEINGKNDVLFKRLDMDSIRAADYLEQEELHHKNAAGLLVNFLLESDIIEFMVGAMLNQAHYDSSLPIEIEVRRTVIKKIKILLENKYFKQVAINYI